ncbi:MAG: hypothetical protein V1736_01480 [Pseudomonadota bacterium]
MGALSVGDVRTGTIPSLLPSQKHYLKVYSNSDPHDLRFKMENSLIITAASRGFGPSLLALLGSLNLNWPNHPRVRVYDIGLDKGTLDILAANQIEVRQVPPFCPHWRKHFAWKIWCWNDAPAHRVIWMDAGLVVLRPIEEALYSIDSLGYFVVPTYHLLTENASESACRGCGVDTGFREGKMTLAATLIGFKKEGQTAKILEQSLSVALTEEHIASVDRMHRHDQAIISLLLYKHLGELVMADGIVYCGWLSPNQTPGQKVWVHRRAILPRDQAHLGSYLSGPGAPYLPGIPRRNGPFRTAWKTVFGIPERYIRRAIRGQIGKNEPPYNGIRD